MFPRGTNVVLEQLKAMPVHQNHSKKHSGDAAADLEDLGSVMLKHKMAIFFCVTISIGCFALCVIATWSKYYKRRAQPLSVESESRSNSLPLNVPQTAPVWERPGNLWGKVFAKKDATPMSKAWPALRRFASRSKSPAVDVEMQGIQRARNARVTTRMRSSVVPTPSDEEPSTWRLQRPEHLRRVQSFLERRRAQVSLWIIEGNQRFQRAFWEITSANVHLPTATRTAHVPAAPEPVTLPNVNRVDHTYHPIYISFMTEGASTSNMLEIPPPTYAQHTRDVIAYLRDYQDPAHASEDARDIQELPPYTPSSAPTAAN